MAVDPITPRSALDRRFSTYVSIIAALVVFANFFRTYYLKDAYGTPVLPTLLHMKGASARYWAMTSCSALAAT